MCLNISSPNLNTVGLVMDAIGVLLLIIKGLPPLLEMIKVEDDSNGIEYQWALYDETDQIRMKKLYDRYKSHKCYLYPSVGLIIIGFLLQIVSNYY